MASSEFDPNFEDMEKEDPDQLTVEEIMKFYESDQYDSTMNVGNDILEILKDVEDNAESNDVDVFQNKKKMSKAGTLEKGIQTSTRKLKTRN